VSIDHGFAHHNLSMRLLFFRKRRQVAMPANAAMPVKTDTANTVTNNRMTDAFVENASEIAETASIILGSLAAIAVVFAWWFSSEDAKRKDVALERYKQESKVEVANANRLAEEAKRDAAVAQLELAKFKAPRILTVEQMNAFAREVESAPKGKVIVVAGSQDAEVLQLVSQLKIMLFRRAGYTDGANGGTSFIPSGLSVRGVVIFSWSVTNGPDHGPPIQRALKTIGITAPAAAKPSLDGETIEIAVGAKPDE